MKQVKSFALFLFVLCGFAALPAIAKDTRNLSVKQSAETYGIRWALVIGNDSYSHISPLKNARADAKAIALALEKAGFKVMLKQDVGLSAMKAAIRSFKGQLVGGDEAVFYFAGHGVQLGAANYLLPVDISGESEEQVKDDAISLQRILDDLQEQKTKFSLAIIDACRNNPFKGQGRAIGGRGLAPTTAATGQMVIYSAGAGQQALDKLSEKDPSPNGLFTRVFLKEMQHAGVSVDRVLRNVREEVVRQARSVGHEQVPAIYDQAIGEFYFRPPAAQTAGTPSLQREGNQPDGNAAELVYWNSVKDGGRAELLAYLEKYPDGQFAELARSRAERIFQDLAALISGQPKMYTSQALHRTPSNIPILYGPVAQALKNKASDAQLRELLASYRQDAERGDPVAQFSLGSIYRTGFGVQQDETEAYRWQKMAAESGLAVAQTNLGAAFLTGKVVGKDEAEAIKWFRKAADQDEAIAISYLGNLYLNGSGVAKDVTEAVKWYRRASNLGYAEAMVYLGDMYYQGLGVSTDEIEALKWYRKAAEQGNPRAVNNLGLMYLNGFGVARDEAEALKWFRKGSDLGDTNAMGNLGFMHQVGKAVARDEIEALKWYRKAAELGNAYAMNSLGLMYLNGLGVAKDEAEALKWFRKGSDLGDTNAMGNLGFMHQVGKAVARDEIEALKWYRKAAELGNAYAMSNLGLMYLNGLGVTRDEAEALKWFRKGSDLGDTNAMTNLGFMYEVGKAVARDEIEALKWYRKAAEKGNENAKASLKRLGTE